ncbi:Imm74 family immunity protein [Gorillibacterium sp. CAU 1737]|uniref:Imm74 family immunity protein n=1 Tax=Gorillibacterium sp. CAU 1737 TaxID=3140362 RepID=UPI003260B8CB
MKITGTSSYIRVELHNRSVKIQGEQLVGGFLAYSDSIANWEPPYDDVGIDEQTKKELIQAVIEKTKNSHFQIKFDDRTF